MRVRARKKKKLHVKMIPKQNECVYMIRFQMRSEKTTNCFFFPLFTLFSMTNMPAKNDIENDNDNDNEKKKKAN